MTNSLIWIPVVAALGASFLTGLLALGLDWLRRRADRGAGRRHERLEAYGRFLSATANFMFMIGTLRMTLQLRSGIDEGIQVTLRHRKAVEPWEFFNEVQAIAVRPLNDAWSLVWISGTKESIAAANRVIHLSTEALGTATHPGSDRGRLAQWLRGIKWTADEEKQYRETLRDLAVARKAFAEIARSEIGAEVADLFGGNEEPALADPVSDGQPDPSRVPTVGRNR